MNTGLRRRHHERHQFLDLAPMVDVTLTLVVFLLLSSESMDIRNIAVHLPQAASAQAEQKSVAIHVNEQGQVFFNDLEIALSDFEGQLQGVERVTIYADKQALHGRVTTIVDRLRSIGIEHIFYGVEAVDTW